MRFLFLFKNISPVSRLFLLLFLVLTCGLLSLSLGYLISLLIWGAAAVTSSDPASNLGFVRFFQIINQICIFILPPLLFALLTEEKPNRFLGNTRPSVVHLIFAVLVIVVAVPFINRLTLWNNAMQLPQFLSGVEEWMRNAEESANALTERLLEEKTIPGLAVNMVMMALLPAIGEELLFRSGLLGVMRKFSGKVHLPVIISAFIFSAIHFQFFSFLPRFVLGMVLGYLFVWSGSVWVPVTAHFVNNSSIVVGSWLIANGYMAESPENLPGMESLPAAGISLVLVLFILYRFRSGWKGTPTGTSGTEI